MAAPGRPRTSYHHGDLRQALVQAGVTLARAGGPDAVVLREAARRAGVTHTAAYRHFADRDELLAAIAAQAAAALAQTMQERLRRRRAPRRRLRAIGEAYIEFAVIEPGLFRVAFGPGEDHGRAGGDHGESRPGPFTLLAGALDDLQASGELPADRRAGAEYAAWSTVHGLSCLLTTGPLSGLSEGERRRVIARVLDSIEAALLAPAEVR